MKKSSFWNFWFSLVPGCGQLYLGATKKGLILLSSFFGLIAVTAFARIEILSFALPVIWFYAFFDALNSIRYTPEELEVADTQFADKCSSFFQGNLLKNKRHGILGILLIIIGIYMLFNNFMPDFIREIEWVRELFHKIPSLFVSLIIIILGFFLIKGKPSKPDFVEYKGDEDNGKQ